MLFNLSFTSLLVGLFAIQTAFAAVVQPLEVRETSNCPKRRFSIQASSGVNSLTGSMSYSVMLVDEKDKPHPEFTSCIFPGTKFQFGAVSNLSLFFSTLLLCFANIARVVNGSYPVVRRASPRTDIGGKSNTTDFLLGHCIRVMFMFAEMAARIRKSVNRREHSSVSLVRMGNSLTAF